MITTTAAHVFAPDHQGEPGYRPHCLHCGGERHPGPIPVPRRPDTLTARTAPTTEPKDER